MKFVVLLLFVILQWIESTVTSCQLRATVRSTELEVKPGEIQQVHQTQLQLQCDNANCPATNFTTCDTYTDLGISQGCMGDECSSTFHLCQNVCGGPQPTGSTNTQCSNSQPATELGSDQPTSVNAYLTDVSCTPSTTVITITEPTNTCSIVRQSPCKTTRMILPIITKAREIPTNVTLTTTITTGCLTWTAGPKCNSSTSTEFTTITVLSTVQPPCTPGPPQLISLSESCSYSQPSAPKPTTPTQGASTSNATSALGALLGICIVLLTLVTAGWMWTCWTVKKRGGIIINSKLNNNTDFINILGPDVNLDDNPAYETKTPLQRNLAYEDTALHRDELQEPCTEEPTYGIIPQAASAKNTTVQILRSTDEGDEYDRLYR